MTVLPDGPTALGHPANEDLFAGAPVRAATSWRVYRSCGLNACGPPVGRETMIPTNARTNADRCIEEG